MKYFSRWVLRTCLAVILIYAAIGAYVYMGDTLRSREFVDRIWIDLYGEEYYHPADAAASEYVFVLYMAKDCTYCKQQLDALRTLVRAEGWQEVEIVLVDTVDDIDTVRQFVSESKVTEKVLLGSAPRGTIGVPVLTFCVKEGGAYWIDVRQWIGYQSIEQIVADLQEE